MSNIDRLRDGYARYSRQDYDLVDDLFADDIAWSVPGTEPLRGRDQVRSFFGSLGEQFASHTIVLDDAVEDGDRLVAFVTHTFTRPDGESASFRAVHDWRFSDGDAVSLDEVADTLAFAQIAGLVPTPA
jgi:ketosteroid isomerase-like protein